MGLPRIQIDDEQLALFKNTCNKQTTNKTPRVTEKIQGDCREI